MIDHYNFYIFQAYLTLMPPKSTKISKTEPANTPKGAGRKSKEAAKTEAAIAKSAKATPKGK